MSELWTGLFDDAAVFPPGSLPFEEAVPAHRRHRRSAYAATVGPFVAPATGIENLRCALDGWDPGSFAVSLVCPTPGTVALGLAAADAIPAIRVAAVEVTMPADTAPEDVVSVVADAVIDRNVPVYVEVPRDERRGRVLTELARSPFFAKFRTGGVRADLHPSEDELAAAIVAAVRTGVPYKATAGLHHAVRNTDPVTRFEQHGFLNVVIATSLALDGAESSSVASVLADRDPARLAARIRDVDPDVRRTFRSFGTCSVVAPVHDLSTLGFLAAEIAS